MPRATDLKAALQNSSPDARSQGLALGWRGFLSSGRSGLLFLCWGLWVMFWRSHEEAMMVRESVGVGWTRGVWERKQKDLGGLLESRKTILESKSHPVAPSWFTDFSFPSYQPKSRASLNGGLQRLAAELYHLCHVWASVSCWVWCLVSKKLAPFTFHKAFSGAPPARTTGYEEFLSLSHLWIVLLAHLYSLPLPGEQTLSIKNNEAHVDNSTDTPVNQSRYPSGSLWPANNSSVPGWLPLSRSV